MAILATDRNTIKREAKARALPVAAAKKIYGGSLVVLNATGYAEPGSVATTLKAAGRAEEQVDNSAGADGDLTVKVISGCFRFANSSAGDLITIADIGNDCYIVDDQTVAKTDGTATRSVAGKIYDVDANGVWVNFTN